jgi:glutaredoxin
MVEPIIDIYSKKGCGRCKEAVKVLGRVQREIPFKLNKVDIASNDDLFRRYKEDVPMIFINGKKSFKFMVDEVELKRRIRKEIIKAGIARVLTEKALNNK